MGKASQVRIGGWRERRKEIEEGDEEDEENRENKEKEGERKKSRVRAERPPAIEQWNTNRLKLGIQKASLRYISIRLNVIRWRHRSKAIWRRYIQNPKARKAYLAANKDKASEEEDEGFNLQTRHSSSIARAIYRRLLNEAMFSIALKQFMFRVASRE